jgi:mono/diheme cytochrome c family protein
MARSLCRELAVGLVVVAIGSFTRLNAAEVSRNSDAAPDAGKTPVDRGWRLLTERAYLPPDFDQDTFDQVWRMWPEPLRSQAEKATPEVRRKMAFSRYGLTERPGDDSGKPLQYVVDDAGNWTMNCFACHGGKVAGQVIPGLPNSRYALATLTEETRALKLKLGKPLSRMDVGSILVPLGSTNGTTNAVNFGVALMAFRDADLNVHQDRLPPKMVHHDMDAPPWWHFKKRKRLYIDGFAQKDHRALMPFLMVPQNGPKKFREWEDEFRDVMAYIESIEPPKYPFDVDRKLARRGEALFHSHCAHCHGTYGAQAAYPEVRVPIDEIGTDRVRLDALPPEHRRNYGASWFGHFGRQPVVEEPDGYVAPPLDGIWASAPYLHNGSVPTLWHVLHPKQRPVVWRRNEDGYDTEKVGLEVETADSVPDSVRTSAERREWFDTRGFGKGAQGHLFPDELDEDQNRAVLEYLKTL